MKGLLDMEVRYFENVSKEYLTERMDYWFEEFKLTPNIINKCRKKLLKKDVRDITDFTALFIPFYSDSRDSLCLYCIIEEVFRSVIHAECYEKFIWI